MSAARAPVERPVGVGKRLAPAPVREFEVIKELLTTYVMPPALTAELYLALGSIPGVTVDRDAVDAAGRRGIGFQITLPRAAGGEMDQLVPAPKTYSLMGQQLTNRISDSRRRKTRRESSARRTQSEDPEIRSRELREADNPRRCFAHE